MRIPGGRPQRRLLIPVGGKPMPVVALVFALKREVWTRLAATIAFSGLAGTTIAALLYYVLGSIETNFWGVAAGLTLGVGAAGLSTAYFGGAGSAMAIIVLSCWVIVGASLVIMAALQRPARTAA